LGKYTYTKWGTRLIVAAFLMRVSRTKQRWEEADIRQRQWCGIKEARQRIVRKEVRELLEAALDKLPRRKAPPATRSQAAR